MTTFIGNHIPIERFIVEDDDDDDLAIAASFLAHLKMLWIVKRVVYRPYRLQEHLYERNPQELIQWQGTEGSRSSSTTSKNFCNEILEAPNSYFVTLFRMPKETFMKLCEWLSINTDVEPSRYQSVEQKVMVFLWICAYNEPQRNTGYRFLLSQSSTSRIFHELIDPMRKLHTRFVRQPKPNTVSPVVELNDLFIQFNGAIGAIDGTHIPAHICLRRQKRFWSRKNNISQNVLAAASFEGLFLYVLAGAEGSINDASLLKLALDKTLVIPECRFYLGDAGFGVRPGIITPYSKVRYHLQEWKQAREQPENAKELYNYRHSSLRTVIERVFGQCKRKWKIIRHSAPEYSFTVQIKIVYAVTGLSNFIKLNGMEPEEYEAEQIEALGDDEREVLEAAALRADDVNSGLTPLEIRDQIAEWLWETY